MNRVADILQSLDESDTLTYVGRVTRVVGMIIEGVMPQARVGATCRLEPPNAPPILAEVVGLREDRAVLMPLGIVKGLSVGTRIVMTSRQPTIQVGEGCLGRVLGPLGEPIDSLGPLQGTESYPLVLRPINPLRRRPVVQPLDLGVRAINSILTCGEGQRIAVVAGAGVGKSTLLGMMARHTRADIAIVALIGERGREVQEFVDRDLRFSEIDSSRIIVVAATSDEPPALRLRGAFTATAIAEYFRDRGHRVLLMMDSLTRVVMAQREIGLSIGEPPATRGYPPSAFSLIPSLLERAGATEKGSITGIYTTLIEDEELADPVGDAVRATSDGHIVLARKLAEAGQFPAIDVVRSVSRVMRNIVEPEHLAAAMKLQELVRNHEAVEDLVSLGAYKSGSNPKYDRALAMADRVKGFLTQIPEEGIGYPEAISELQALVRSGEYVEEPVYSRNQQSMKR